MIMMMLADYICILITLAELLLYMIIIIVDDYGRGEDDGDKEIEMKDAACCWLRSVSIFHRPTTAYKIFCPCRNIVESS